MDASPNPLTLIERAKNTADTSAWSEFVSLYAPLVRRVARRAGLQWADADDLTQDVFRAVAAALPDLAVRPAQFRGWLYTLTRNKVIDFRRGAKRRTRAAGGADGHAALGEVAAPPARPVWEREYHDHVLRWVCDRAHTEFRLSTWRAFWWTAVDGRAVADVGRELGMSPGAVHVARSRVLARLKEVARAYTGDE